MKKRTNDLHGFIVRRYSDYMDMHDYALIECDILGSPGEVLDEILNALKAQTADAGDKALSEKEWKSVRSKIKKFAHSDHWTFDPNAISELKGATVPVSLKVNRVRLSNRLVRSVKQRVDPTLGVVPHVFEYDAFMSRFQGSVTDDPCPPPEFPAALAAFRRGEPIHLFRNGKPYVRLEKTKSAYVEIPYEPSTGNGV